MCMYYVLCNMKFSKVSVPQNRLYVLTVVLTFREFPVPYVKHFIFLIPSTCLLAHCTYISYSILHIRFIFHIPYCAFVYIPYTLFTYITCTLCRENSLGAHCRSHE